MRNEIEIEFDPFASLHDVVLKLQEKARDNNKNYFINYYGVKLESRDIDIDKAYIKCYGFDTKYVRENIENMMECVEKDADLKSPVIREWGKKYINPLKHPLWNDFLKNPNFVFPEILLALEIIKMLEEESDLLVIKEKMYNRGLSGMQAWGVLIIVLMLSSRGVEFYKLFPLDEEKRIRVKKQEELNKMLDKGVSLDEAMERLKEYKFIRIMTENKFIDGRYEKMADVLVKKDNAFEGISKEDDYITGVLNDNVISFVLLKEEGGEHYCGIRNDEEVYLRKEKIGNNQYEGNGNVKIKIKEINHNFEDEIYFNSKITKGKRYLEKEEKNLLKFYINNRDLIIDSSLLYLDEEINSSKLDRYYKKHCRGSK